jgi:acetate kinase
MKILVVNAGSTTLKYQLFNTDDYSVMAKGNCERIGDGGRVEHKIPGKTYAEDVRLDSHAEAVAMVVKLLTDSTYGCIDRLGEISAVGHRIVQGGPNLSESVIADENAMAELEKCREIDPLHIPGAIMGIEACKEAIPGVPQVLVFDTAFHHTMPPEAYTYPIPAELAEKYHIRKYGFHGTSHRYVSSEMIRILGGNANGTKIVTCHLGGGSSIAAVKDGKVLDTSMGFTPLDGLVMSTRCGSIDPAAVLFLMEKEGITAREMDTLLNRKSGLFGIAGMGDCRDLCAAMDQGDERATVALKTLCYQIKKYIGSYAAAMGGLDAIVFTAGIGENQAIIREKSVEGLEFLGVSFDKDANNAVKRPASITCLSKPDSRVKVYLIPTNEELVIARDTAEIAAKTCK